jgi:hypothetical protein
MYVARVLFVLGEHSGILVASSKPKRTLSPTGRKRHAEFKKKFGLEAPAPKVADDVYLSSHQNLK